MNKNNLQMRANIWKHVLELSYPVNSSVLETQIEAFLVKFTPLVHYICL